MDACVHFSYLCTKSPSLMSKQKEREEAARMHGPEDIDTQRKCECGRSIARDETYSMDTEGGYICPSCYASWLEAELKESQRREDDLKEENRKLLNHVHSLQEDIDQYKKDYGP